MPKSTKSILFNLSLVTFISLVNLQCTNHSQSKSNLWDFSSIRFHNELFLIQTDDKYGEWGGDTYFFRIYKNKQSENLLIDYIEYKGKVGNPPPPDQNSELKINWFTGQPKVFEKKGIIANNEYLILISNAVNELVKTRVNNDELVSMAGVVNRVMYSDSSFIIEDYPSSNWDKFQILKSKMKNE